MESNAKVVVIGGGVIGCSVAYHLTKKGWDGVVLCEKDELAVWATAYAAGHVILYTLDPTISRLNQYGVGIYPKLEAETGFSPGFHPCGNLRLATHPDRLDEFYRYIGIAEAMGAEACLIDADEVGRLWPLMQTEGILAGLLNPNDGHASPADLAQAFAAGARRRGAKIHRQCEVRALKQLPSGQWEIETSKGVITCDHVVSCTGNHARRTARLLGGEAQCVPVRHQYVITETISELVERREAGLPEMPVVRDPEESFYVRQEGDALVMGAYDGRGDAKFLEDVPDGNGSELFPDEIDKLLPYFERAMGRIPVLERTGVRNVVNYAMPYTPDDLPMTGPAFGLKNLWLAEGNPFGITLAGGIGWQIAEWIVEGEPSIDMGSCDSTRFGDWATRKWSARKVEEAYEHTYLIPKPGEELPAARELRTTPLHDLLAAKGAVFGVVAGWEHAKWFTAQSAATAEAAIAAECRQATVGAVIADLSQKPRFRVRGTGAISFMQRVVCTEIPEIGEAATGYALGLKGTFRSVFSIFRESHDSFLLTSTPTAQRHDLDGLIKSRLPGEKARVDDLTGTEGTLLLFGASARALLTEAAGSDLGDDPGVDLGDAAFPVGTGRGLTVGYAPARVIRIDPFGFEGWELHVRLDMLRHVYLTLADARPIGSLALDVLRLEGGVPAWGSELTHDFSPKDAGLTRLVADRKAFTGWAMLHDQKPAYRLVRLRVSTDAPTPLGVEPVRDGTGRVVGRTTSGAHGVLSGTNLAFAYVERDVSDAGLEVGLLGEWHSCAVAH